MRQRRKNESWLTCAQRSRDTMKDFGSGLCLLPLILFPSPSVSDPLLSCSFSLFCIFFSPVLEMAKTVANLFFFCLISGDENWFSSLPYCFFSVTSLLSLSLFFLLFFSSVFVSLSLSPAGSLSLFFPCFFHSFSFSPVLGFFFLRCASLLLLL